MTAGAPGGPGVSVKICGITRETEAVWLNEARVSYAGFVLYEKSKRHVTCGQAKRIFKKLNKNIIKVAVVVRPDDALLDEIERNGFDIIQVHGEWMPGMAERVTLPIWQAINLSEPGEIYRLSDMLWQGGSLLKESRISALLVDAKEYGSGKTFGWEQFAAGEGRRLFFGLRERLREHGIGFVLAGGLTPENVGRGIALFEPDIVDVSSGVERTDGHFGKDAEKIRRFTEEVRNTMYNKNKI